MQDGVSGQLGDAQHGVVGRWAGVEDGSDERAGDLHLVGVGREHLFAQRCG
jgi:hypothetical protein